jgi:hypothetical protein
VAFASVPLVFASSAMASTTIDTTPSWNGSQVVCPFGYSNTATYGQTVTLPASDGNADLDSFTFYMAQPTSLLFRGEVYAWNSSTDEATGPALYESSATHTTNASGFQPITFNTGGLLLTPGAQYVLFATISNDYAADSSSGSGCWGSIATDVYSGGSFVFTNNSGNTAAWTTKPWNVGFYGAADLAFTATFSPYTPGQLCAATETFVNSSAASKTSRSSIYARLDTAQACGALAGGFIRAYESDVTALYDGGFLTSAQEADLDTLAGALL